MIRCHCGQTSANYISLQRYEKIQTGGIVPSDRRDLRPGSQVLGIMAGVIFKKARILLASLNTWEERAEPLSKLTGTLDLTSRSSRETDVIGLIVG